MRTPYIIELTPAQCRLALHAMLQFRNKVIAQGIAPVDIDELIVKLSRSPLRAKIIWHKQEDGSERNRPFCNHHIIPSIIFL